MSAHLSSPVTRALSLCYIDLCWQRPAAIAVGSLMRLVNRSARVPSAARRLTQIRSLLSISRPTSTSSSTKSVQCARWKLPTKRLTRSLRHTLTATLNDREKTGVCLLDYSDTALRAFMNVKWLVPVWVKIHYCFCCRVKFLWVSCDISFSVIFLSVDAVWKCVYEFIWTNNWCVVFHWNLLPFLCYICT